MKRALTIAIVALCFAAPFSYVTAGSDETGGSYAIAGSRAPGRVRPAEFVPDHVNPYSAAPRIIHVPDANERASLNRDTWPNDDRADAREREVPLRAAPAHRPHPVVKHAKPHQTIEPKRTEHRRPYNTSARAAPPAPIEHRAILSAPPPPVDELSPIRPTPRFGAPVPTQHSADQHAEAPAPAAPAASEPQEVTAESVISAIPSNAPAEEPAAPAEP
jgi:hypothetical protein